MSLVYPIAGGVLIGLAAVWLFLSLGRIAGISGIAANAMNALQTLIGPTTDKGEDTADDPFWPLFFLVGLGGGGALAYTLTDINVAAELRTSAIPLLIVGGLLVGFGTRLGSGCTSGHGVCGISRFSLRSLLATVCFLVVGMITATSIWLVSS